MLTWLFGTLTCHVSMWVPRADVAEWDPHADVASVGPACSPGLHGTHMLTWHMWDPHASLTGGMCYCISGLPLQHPLIMLQ